MDERWWKLLTLFHTTSGYYIALGVASRARDATHLLSLVTGLVIGVCVCPFNSFHQWLIFMLSSSSFLRFGSCCEWLETRVHPLSFRSTRNVNNWHYKNCKRPTTRNVVWACRLPKCSLLMVYLPRSTRRYCRSPDKTIRRVQPFNNYFFLIRFLARS